MCPLAISISRNGDGIEHGKNNTNHFAVDWGLVGGLAGRRSQRGRSGWYRGFCDTVELLRTSLRGYEPGRVDYGVYPVEREKQGISQGFS